MKHECQNLRQYNFSKMSCNRECNYRAGGGHELILDWVVAVGCD